ncbi:MAG: DUF2125 domain-containing protein [Alphaproteobacteria bacterium]|nr:DUF2125 domain-containing protein [Alphaproteobacteria bacterium]
MSRKPPSRTALLVPFAIMALVIALHGAYWVFMSGQIRTTAETWIGEQRAAGYAVSHEGLTVSGYPFRFSLRARAPVLAAPDEAGGWSIAYERIAASAQFYNLNHWILVLGGHGELATLIGGAPARYQIEAASLRLSATGESGANTRIGAEAEELVITALEGPAPAFGRIGRLALAGILSDADVLRLRIDVSGADAGPGVLPQRIEEAFGVRAGEMRIDAELTQWSALAGAGDPLAWTRAGGGLEINQALLDWGPAQVSGSGRLSLDETLMPEGRLSVVVSNPERLAGALVMAGLVNEEQGQALRLAALMAPPRQDGIALPFRLQGGAVFLGPARLGGARPGAGEPPADEPDPI